MAVVFHQVFRAWRTTRQDSDYLQMSERCGGSLMAQEEAAAADMRIDPLDMQGTSITLRSCDSLGAILEAQIRSSTVFVAQLLIDTTKSDSESA